MDKIYEKLALSEAKELANELFPIGSTIIVHLDDDNGCPAIILGHLFEKDAIEESLKLLQDIEVNFQSICKVVVLRGKQKIVCFFIDEGDKLKFFSTKSDKYSMYEEFEGWEKVGKHII